MAWVVESCFGAIKASAKLHAGVVPFPAVTKQTTKVPVNARAMGVSTGGTRDMTPSTTKGKHLKEPLLVLQFMAKPKYTSTWSPQSGGVPAVLGVKERALAARFLSGTWAEPMHIVSMLGPLNNTGNRAWYREERNDEERWRNARR